MPENKIYGTSNGRVITDAEIEAMADEAEVGYDLTRLRRRVAQHPVIPGPGEVAPSASSDRSD
jgi:hypothetical protein